MVMQRVHVSWQRFSSVQGKIYNVSAQPSTMYEVIEGMVVALGRDHPRLHVPASPMLMAANFLHD